MGDEKVGYGKPPKHAQFQPGVCPNPKGRGSGRDFNADEIMNKVLLTKIAFQENGKRKTASRLELAIRRLAAEATKGKVVSAALLLKLWAHAKKHRDTDTNIIRVIGDADLD